MACLPDRLKAEIAIHVHLDTLKRVDIFQNTEAGFLCELVLRLKPVLFSPGDYVCRKGEVGHEMYIVSRGILEVVQDGGKQVVATLKAGSYFGEISVLSVGSAGNRRTASVRSVGYSVLFCLNKRDMWDVLRNYPNAEARIRSRAEERLVKLGQPQQQQQQVGPTSTNGAKNVKSPAGCKLRPTGSLMGCEVTTKSAGHRRRVHSSASSCQVSRSGAKQEAPNIGKYSRCRCSVQLACRKCIGAHDDDHQQQQEADEQDYVCPLECCDGHHDGGRRRRPASRRQQQQPASRLYATSTSSSMQPITGTRSLRHRRNEQHEHRHQHRHHYHHKSRGPLDECCVPSTAARQASLDGQPTTTTTTISPTVMKTKRAVSEMIQRDSDEDEEDADDDEDGDEENDDDDDDDSNDLGHPDQWHSSLAAATTANDHSRPSDGPAKRAGHQLG